MFIPPWLLVLVVVAVLLLIPSTRRVLMVLAWILGGMLYLGGMYFLLQGDKQTAYLFFIPISPFMLWLLVEAMVTEWKRSRGRDSK